MFLRRWLPVTCVLALALTFLVDYSPAAAQKKTEDDEPEVDQVALLAQAYQLAEFGKAKNYPEALLAAARLLREVGPLQPGKELDEKGEEIKTAPPQGKAPSLVDESNELIKEALKRSERMGKDMQAAIKAMAKSIQDETRSPLNGPKYFQDSLNPGQHRTLHIAMRPSQPGVVVAHASNNVRIEVVVHGGDQVRARNFGNAINLPFHAAKTAPHAIVVTNRGKQPTMFRVVVR